MFLGMFLYKYTKNQIQKTHKIIIFLEISTKIKILLHKIMVYGMIIRHECAFTCDEAGGGHRLRWGISVEYVRF